MEQDSRTEYEDGRIESRRKLPREYVTNMVIRFYCIRIIGRKVVVIRL